MPRLYLRWKTAAVVARFGKEPDTYIARSIGVAAETIADHRIRMGIPAAPSSTRRRPGPKPVGGLPLKRRRSTVSINRGIYQALEARCHQLGVSIAGTVDTLIRDYLDAAGVF